MSTLWYVLEELAAGELESVLQVWVQSWELKRGLCVDGKTLRGSKRRGQAAALQVMTAVGQEMQVILEQRGVPAGDELADAIQLLEMLPIEGRVVSADAGILKSPFVNRVVEKRGATSG